MPKLSKQRVMRRARRIYRLSQQDGIRFDGKSVKRLGCHTWREAMAMAWQEERLHVLK